MDKEYRLKGINSLDLQVGEKREVEVEGVEGVKILLVNVGGNITALGAKCTHYGLLAEIQSLQNANSF
jgi:nitrite reductase/ring-hydroxylating ferredoxin subunit